MSVSSEQHASAKITCETHIHPHSACASCCELPAENEHDHEHRFEIAEVLRVVFVALAATQGESPGLPATS
jgi:hypothetical protein